MHKNGFCIYYKNAKYSVLIGRAVNEKPSLIELILKRHKSEIKKIKNKIMKTEEKTDKWELWKSYDNWRFSNANRLSRDYDKLRAEGKLDNVSYQDYIGGRWQNNIL